MERMCGNCKYRMWHSWSGVECCMDYEMSVSKEDEIKSAADCKRYEYGNPSGFDDEYYTPSATARDYGPSNPWDAPGMSVRDFI